MWREGYFVLDTNVLLDLYRYSNRTREELVKVLRGVEERLWLPHQVADEYMTCRLDVIHQKRKAYEDLRKSLDEVQARVEKQMEELHRDRVVEAEDLLEDVRQACTKLAARLKEREDELPKLTSSPEEDEVWQVVDEIFRQSGRSVPARQKEGGL